MASFARANELYKQGRYQEALDEYIELGEIFGKNLVQYDVKRCELKINKFVQNLPIRSESHATQKDASLFSSDYLYGNNDLICSFHQLQENLERLYAEGEIKESSSQKNMRFALQDLNLSYRRGDYLSALMGYREYTNYSQIIANKLSIQTNINMCLKELGVIKKNMPYISVIIPVYNVEGYLGRCLDSVLRQTLKNIQIIIVNDGSSDNSLSLAKSYADRDHRIVILSNSQSSGNSGTPRNQALHYASGEYICFVDADDYIDENMLKDLYFKAKFENADVCTSNGFYREIEGCDSEKIIFPDIRYDKDNCQDILSLPQFPIIWYRIYRSEFLRKNKIKFGEFRVSADVIFSLKSLLLSNKTVKVDNIYYHYNFDRPGSTIDRRKGEQALDLFKSYEFIMEFLKENKFKNCYSLIMKKFIGDYFYCTKNMHDSVKLIFDEFSGCFTKKYIHFIEDRSIISDFSNQTLDKLCSGVSNDGQSKYHDFIVNDMNSCDVSVVIPVHNLDLYLSKCLNSVIVQRLKNIEIIIVNDASEDSSGAIIEKFYQIDNRMKVITINQASGSPGIVRNVGMEIARGEYITFVDGDDWIDGEYLSRLYAAITKDEKEDVIYSRAFIREEVGGSTRFNFNVPRIKYLHDSSRVDLIKSNFFSNVWGRLYRRKFLNKNNILFPKMYVSEDLTFSLLCAFLANSIEIGDTQGYHYRYDRPNSTTELRKGVAALKQIFSYDEFIGFMSGYSLGCNLLDWAVAKKVNSLYYTYNMIHEDYLRDFFRLEVRRILKNYNLSKELFSEKEYLNYLKLVG